MTKFTTKDITTPKSGLVIYTTSYWLCVDGDPKQALFYGESPQCNKDKRICEHLLRSGSYAGRIDLQITYVETAFVPQRN